MLRGRYRWVICALLFVATTINYIDRQVIGLLKPDLQTAVHVDRARLRRDRLHVPARLRHRPAPRRPGDGQAGDARRASRSPSCCGASRRSATPSPTPFPWLRFPTLNLDEKTGVSFVTLGGAAAGFALARFLLGLGEAGNFPASIKTVAEWFPRKERAFATGIFNSGTNIGALITPLIVPCLRRLVGLGGRVRRHRPARLLLADLVAGQLRPAAEATRRSPPRSWRCIRERSAGDDHAGAVGLDRPLPPDLGLRARVSS